MRVRIDIRIEEQRLKDIRGYCDRNDKNLTAFIDKGIDLMFDKYNVKNKYIHKKRWHGPVRSMRMYSTRKTI